ncbi:MAG: ABC transporter ATP-binding protein/permease [Anaerolineae bacterium]|nr:ABC transporter ATP-binding protein/permease [Anaerolineae bacterium]
MAAIMRGLDAEAYDREYTDRELVDRIVAYFSLYKRRAILVVVSLILLAFLGAAPPIIVAQGVALREGQDDALLAATLVASIFFVGVATWGVNWVRRLYTVKVIQDVVLAMRHDAFTAAANQDMSFYDEFSSGRVVSRITSDTEEFGQIVGLAADVIQQMISAIILVVILFTIDWRLTLAVLVMAPFVVMAALAFRNIARRVTRQSSRVLGEVNKSIQESVTGISVAKNYRQEQAIYAGFQEVNAQAYSINIRRGFVLANIFPTLNVLAGIGTALLVWLGGAAAIAGVISVAAWYLFVATVERFWFPVMNLSAFWSQFQQGLSAAERVFGLVDSEPSVIQTAGEVPPPLAGAIEFDEVIFAYTQNENVLEKFSTSIAPGETVALVGHTGAGKSSIIKLLTRFYEFQGGAITVDGLDIRSLDLTAYRRQLGVVSQIPFLFDGTVADNIRYPVPDATDEDILAVANRIGDGEWLETLPDGIQSHVGERGSRLSMGQRQLVALTRVLIESPCIFILDEATANIDPFTESQIQQALKLVMAERTSIVIAHRLSTVRNADRIIVLDHGRIIEEGSHEALLEQGGEYAELYNAYFRHQSLAYIEQRGWVEPASAD